MTEKEKKMLPVLGVIVLFAVYWLFIRGGDESKPRRRGRPKPPAAKPAKPGKPAVAKPRPTAGPPKKGVVDAGVPVAVNKTPDAAPIAPPQEWTIMTGAAGRVEWVADKGRVIKDDVIVKFRGYGRAERARAGSAKTLERLQKKLNVISDSLRAAMRSDDVSGMRRYERRVQDSQRAVERAEARLAASKRRANDLAVRAPGSGVFTPAIKAGARLKAEQRIGIVKE